MMDLREKIKTLPLDPGVYLMKNDKGNVIYVGKAKNLRSRILSYFKGTDHLGKKTRALVDEVKNLDIIITKTEVEALLLERTLIRHNRPHYNILLRDDKEYPFVRVNFNDTWPRIEKVRRRKDDGATYVGPFGSASLLNLTLRTIYRIFPLIQCSPYTFKSAKRPCNYYHMKMCLAPCSLAVDRDEYVVMVKNALTLLQGKNKELKKSLTSKMNEAAKNEKFEVAAAYRDQINALIAIAEKQVAFTQKVDHADVVSFCESNDYMTFHVMMIRDRTIISGENFISSRSADEAYEALTSFLLQYYDNRSLPKNLVIPIDIEEKEELLQALNPEAQSVDQLKTKVITRLSGEYKELMKMATKNAKHHLDEAGHHNEKSKVELETLKSQLGLDIIPYRIECIDISNLQAAAIVAANVCFIGGKPARDLYRHYKIRSVSESPDDYASIYEVVKRRIIRGIRDDDLPDLLVIDGGRGQLNAALEASKEFTDAKLNIISLAKSRKERQNQESTDASKRSYEKVFLPQTSIAIPLAVGTSTYRILIAIRDEAHRFAITFHRKQRSKEFFHSNLLDSICGLGPILRKRILEQFGSLDALKSASLEDIQKIKGVSEKLAVALHSSLKLEDDQ